MVDTTFLFPSYHIISDETQSGKIIVAVLDEVADWIWQQDCHDWTTVEHPPDYIYTRFAISKELLLLLALRWPQ